MNEGNTFHPETANEAKLVHLFQTYLSKSQTLEVDLAIVTFDMDQCRAENERLKSENARLAALHDGTGKDSEGIVSGEVLN